MKAWILNDTSGHLHPGCDLTMEVYREQCDRVGIDILGTVPSRMTKLEPLYKEFDKADLLIVNGEGSIHDNLRPELLLVAEQYPAVLINCVYQKNLPRPCVEKFLYKAARESLSAKELKAEVVPDLVFASNTVREFQPGWPIFALGITDSVQNPGKGISIRCKHPEHYLTRLSDYRHLVCGRFHAVVMAATIGRPLLAYPSNTWKIKGLMRDMGMAWNYYDSAESASKAAWPMELPEAAKEYVRRAPERINAMFEKLPGLV